MSFVEMYTKKTSTENDEYYEVLYKSRKPSSIKAYSSGELKFTVDISYDSDLPLLWRQEHVKSSQIDEYRFYYKNNKLTSVEYWKGDLDKIMESYGWNINMTTYPGLFNNEPHK